MCSFILAPTPIWSNLSLSHIQKPKVLEVFPSKIKLILTGKQVAWCYSFKYRCISFEPYMWFLNLAQQSNCEKTVPISTLKGMLSTKCSFQEVTQFSLCNNILNTPNPNQDSFLVSDMWVTSTELNRPIWNKDPITTLKNPHFRKYPFQKRAQLSQGNNMKDAAPSKVDGSLWREHVFLPVSWIRHWNERRLSPCWKVCFAGSILFKL
jgi:hypothetical protein